MAKMILVIEDETAIQNVIRAFLEDAGYTVALASDGLEGIRQFRAHRPDLVLLDLMLPKIDGFAVCEILRGESRVPIIMLTALDDDSSQLKGFDALADDYITKPFSMPVVLKHIEAVLRRAEPGAAPGGVHPLPGDHAGPGQHDRTCGGGKRFSDRQGVRDPETSFGKPGPGDLQGAAAGQRLGLRLYRQRKDREHPHQEHPQKAGVDCIETIRGAGYKIEKET